MCLRFILHFKSTQQSIHLNLCEAHYAIGQYSGSYTAVFGQGNLVKQAHAVYIFQTMQSITM